MADTLQRFLRAKVQSITFRAGRLSRLTPQDVGIRARDVPYAPSAAHFAAANARLGEIDRDVRRALSRLNGRLRDAPPSPDEVLERNALLEREIDRARRAYGLFFDVFSQRGTRFAPALAACDAIAVDCFQAVRQAAPGLMHSPMLKPLTYLEHGFSPATFRRGVLLSRLLGERNPFPLIRVPYERVEAPWGMGVILHEIGHNLQADLSIWQETQVALQRRVLHATGNPWLTRLWGRWHKEIFADLIACLLGGPASVHSMKDFLAYPSSRVLTFHPLSAHPTPFLRVFIQAEMLRRMGFQRRACDVRDNWDRLYRARLPFARIPRLLLSTAARLIPHVVDEIAFQPRRGLAQRALVDVVPFWPSDQERIDRAAESLARGHIPPGLPPRHVVSASREALERRLASPERISRTVLNHLVKLGTRNARMPGVGVTLAA
ncbi:hypothetical protein D7X30_02935 [Corallococcus sp. AB011P]|uniref:hypothetical protein n=1 Tax=unclassified Corallococcus TaxID=2685029 RepID=UPI000EA2F714|nr:MULTISPECIES: hypothetical protein [unclassified Corallococcus]RKG62285.1 hypothetical protein D7X30_02935 [Corallococcus sp. AB011P]RKH80056.1 hypothetical protein D7Y21_32855 [Corallococcus sp. AB045]